MHVYNCEDNRIERHERMAAPFYGSIMRTNSESNSTQIRANHYGLPSLLYLFFVASITAVLYLYRSIKTKQMYGIVTPSIVAVSILFPPISCFLL